jgi:hypothetical protein
MGSRDAMKLSSKKIKAVLIKRQTTRTIAVGDRGYSGELLALESMAVTVIGAWG